MICEWELWEDSTVGSDHYPIFCTIHVDKEVMVEERDAKWIFSQAKWDQFEYLCELEGSRETDLDQDIEEVEV